MLPFRSTSPRAGLTPAAVLRILGARPVPPAHDPPMPAPPLDPQALARLRELDPDGRHGVLARVLAAFEASLARMLGQLAALRGRADAMAVRDIAHTLKSSSASVGATALSQLCADVERRLRDGPAPGEAVPPGEDIDRLLAEGQAALAAVAAVLRPVSSGP